MILNTRRTFLLLQGPYGDLFQKLALELESQGHRAIQVVFNGGDEYFAKGAETVEYFGDADTWSEYVADLMFDKSVTDVVCFSDCRLYHQVANMEAKSKGVNVWVLEEGYLRPDYFTIERDGVNALSRLRLGPDMLFAYDKEKIPAEDDETVGGTFGLRMSSAIKYYLHKFLARNRFKHFQHHRSREEWQEGLCWILSGIRKINWKSKEAQIYKEINDRPFYSLLLQMHEDFQLRKHSEYGSMTEVIREVMSSFAANGPSDSVLIIKHHPIDRGFHNYQNYIRTLEYSLKLKGRVFYIFDMDLPKMLKKTMGVVTVNSTAGLSALIHTKPVKVLGRAIYDIPGLTYQSDLDDFWISAASPNERVEVIKGEGVELAPKALPDEDLVEKLVTYLRINTQLNGSLHKNTRQAAKKIADRMLGKSLTEGEQLPEIRSDVT